MASGDRKEFLCKVCGEAITFASGGVFCRTCSTLHHRSCWEYNGQCSVYACGETRFQICDLDELAGQETRLTPAEAVAAPVKEKLPAVRARSEPAAPPAPGPGAGELPELVRMLSSGDLMQGTIYCPECHAVNPRFAPTCAFCDFPVEKAARLDPAMTPRGSLPSIPAPVLIIRSLDRIASVGVGLLGTFLTAEALAGLWAVQSAGRVLCGNYLTWLAWNAIVGPLMILGALALHVVGSYYEMGRAWARWFQLPLCLVLLVSFPFGTIFGLAMLVSWLAPSSRKFFHRREPPVPALTLSP